jgi:hypothetical protein
MPNKDSVMAEALIAPSQEHPLLYVPLEHFLHLETQQDYDALVEGEGLVEVEDGWFSKTL